MSATLEAKKKMVIKHAKCVRNAVLKTHDVRGNREEGYNLYTRKAKLLGKLKVPDSISVRVVPEKYADYITAAKLIVNRDKTANPDTYKKSLQGFYHEYHDYAALEVNNAANALVECVQLIFGGTKITNKGFNKKTQKSKIRLRAGTSYVDVYCPRKLESTDQYLTYQFLLGELTRRFAETPDDLSLMKVRDMIPNLNDVILQYAKSTIIFLDVGPMQYSLRSMNQMNSVIGMLQ